MLPNIVDIVVVIRVGMKMSVGMAAPICALYIIMLMGMMTNPEVLITRNMIIGLLAVSFWGFSS